MELMFTLKSVESAFKPLHENVLFFSIKSFPIWIISVAFWTNTEVKVKIPWSDEDKKMNDSDGAPSDKMMGVTT